MSNITCEACQLTDDTKSSTKCAKCGLLYHLHCVNLTAEDATLDWLCPSCSSKVRRGDNTPARPPTPQHSGSSNVTTRKKPTIFLSSDEPTASNFQILAEIKLMRQDIFDLKQQLNSVSDNLAQCNRHIQELELRSESHNQRIQLIEMSQPEITILQEKTILLEDQLRVQTQAVLRNEVELIGLPETPNENLCHILLTASCKLGGDLQERDIDWAERSGPLPTQNRNLDRQRSRPVVVRFVRRAQRDAFLRAAKLRHNLSTSDLELPGPAGRIYFNERLTKAGRALFRETRTRARVHGFRHCWTKNGTIHIRKEEGRSAIPIRSQSDMDRHLPATDNPV